MCWDSQNLILQDLNTLVVILVQFWRGLLSLYASSKGLGLDAYHLCFASVEKVGRVYTWDDDPMISFYLFGTLQLRVALVSKCQITRGLADSPPMKRRKGTTVV